MLNGDGLRVVLWVSGCEHHCPECQNPITWDINDGLEFGESAKKEIFDELSRDYITGITFSGGDPLHTQNREDVGKLVMEISDKFPDKTIWIYTGYEWQDVKDLPFMSKVDVLVDGRFVKTLCDVNIPWRGSSNQKVIDVKQSLKLNKIVLVVK